MYTRVVHANKLVFVFLLYMSFTREFQPRTQKGREKIISCTHMYTLMDTHTYVRPLVQRFRDHHTHHLSNAVSWIYLMSINIATLYLWPAWYFLVRRDGWCSVVIDSLKSAFVFFLSSFLLLKIIKLNGVNLNV